MAFLCRQRRFFKTRTNEYLTGGWGNKLTPAMATSSERDATLVIRKTTEQADP